MRRQPLGGMPGKLRIWHAVQNAVDELLPKFVVVCQAFFALCIGHFQRLRHPHNQRGVVGSCASAAFMAAAALAGRQFHTIAHIQRANALRPIKLVAREAHHINAQFLHIKRKLACRLHGICVEQDMSFTRSAGQKRDILHCAHLVVGVDDAGDNGIFLKNAGEILRIDHSCAVNRHKRRLKALYQA